MANRGNLGDPLAFLDAKTKQYTRLRPSWLIAERRAYGGDLILPDLWQFKGESSSFYKKRQEGVSYTNFMQIHAAKVTGQLRATGAPRPGSGDFSMGTLGQIRPKQQIRRVDASIGELMYYAIDGGNWDSGSEWPVFFDTVDELAQHTGYRVLYCDARRPPKTNAEEEDGVSPAQLRAGYRPYLAAFSPLDMPFHVIRNGIFEGVILRVDTEVGRVVDGRWVDPGAGGYLTPAEAGTSTAYQAEETSLMGKGYLLLVRAGSELFGPTYKRGGYWLYSSDKKKLLRTGSWARTGGEIPVWLHYGEKSSGTHESGALGRAATDGLGRIGVSLMNILSAWDFDIWDACASLRFFLNANKAVMTDVTEQWEMASLNIGVPPAVIEDTAETLPVTIYDSSASAVATGIMKELVAAKYDQANEQSFQALTSLPGSSGLSKELGYREDKAPYLARRASYRQQSESTAINLLEMRSSMIGPDGVSGFCAYKEEYPLKPLVDDIEKTFQLMKQNGMRSATMEPPMMLQAVKERLGKIPLLVDQRGEPIGSEEDVIREFKESVGRAVTASDQDASLRGIFGA